MDPLAAMVSMGNTETDPFNIIDATNIKTVGDLMDATVVTLSTSTCQTTSSFVKQTRRLRFKPFVEVPWASTRTWRGNWVS